jgi:hypothetical protein
VDFEYLKSRIPASAGRISKLLEDAHQIVFRQLAGSRITGGEKGMALGAMASGLPLTLGLKKGPGCLVHLYLAW